MLDLLDLPGIRPVDIQSSNGSITMTAVVFDAVPPPCPTCGKPLHRHGHRKIAFADTPLQRQPVRLVIDRPRYRCEACGRTLTVELPFLDEKRRVTRRLIEDIRSRCLGATFHGLSEQTGLAVNTVKNIALDLVADLGKTICYETPAILGISELMIAGQSRCVLTNLATNTLFDLVERRTKSCLMPYFRDLPSAEKVEWVHADHWPSFEMICRQHLPKARLVMNKKQDVEACANGVAGLAKVVSKMGRSYSYEVIRAKVLYAKAARSVGSGDRTSSESNSGAANGSTNRIEYGPHIPTLVEMSETGELA